MYSAVNRPRMIVSVALRAASYCASTAGIVSTTKVTREIRISTRETDSKPFELTARLTVSLDVLPADSVLASVSMMKLALRRYRNVTGRGGRRRVEFIIRAPLELFPLLYDSCSDILKLDFHPSQCLHSLLIPFVERGQPDPLL